VELPVETSEIVKEVMEEEQEAQPDNEQSESLAEQETETPAEEVVEQVTEPEKTTVSDYVPEEVAEQPKEEVKTVPLGALHEEREKRKDLQKELEELKKQQSTNYLDDYSLDSTEDDYVKKLERRLENLEAKDKRIEERRQVEDEQRLVEKVSKELAEEGYPWFKELGADKVRAEFNAMLNTDPEYVMAHQNPDGWKKWYKERTYPMIKQAIEEQQKRESTSSKINAKKNAQLVTKIGQKAQPKSEEEKRPKTEKELFEEYMSERRMGAL
jgi:hypothetical protein